MEMGPCRAPSGCDHRSNLLLNSDASVTVFQMMTRSEAVKQHIRHYHQPMFHQYAVNGGRLPNVAYC